MTGFEDFVFPELAVGGMECLFGSVIPAYTYSLLSLLRSIKKPMQYVQSLEYAAKRRRNVSYGSSETQHLDT